MDLAGPRQASAYSIDTVGEFGPIGTGADVLRDELKKPGRTEGGNLQRVALIAQARTLISHINAACAIRDALSV
jgi:hypothetical protein